MDELRNALAAHPFLNGCRGQKPRQLFSCQQEDEKVDRGSGRRHPPIRAQAEGLRTAAHRLKTLRRFFNL
jgi:hypothetical protein